MLPISFTNKTDCHDIAKILLKVALNIYKPILFVITSYHIHILYLFFFFFFTENRHLTDTQFRLSDNSNTQRQLNEAAFHAEMDLKAKQIEQKLEVGEIDIIHQDWVMYKFLDLQQLKEIFGRSIALQRI